MRNDTPKSPQFLRALGALCGRTQLALDGFDAEGGLGYTIEIWQNWRIQHENINGNLWKYRMTHDDICFTKSTSDLGLVPEKGYSHWLYGNETLGKMWLENIIFLWMEVFWYHIFRQSRGTMCDRKFISKDVWGDIPMFLENPTGIHSMSDIFTIQVGGERGYIQAGWSVETHFPIIWMVKFVVED